jgi:hypothetical protein
MAAVDDGRLVANVVWRGENAAIVKRCVDDVPREAVLIADERDEAAPERDTTGRRCIMVKDEMWPREVRPNDVQRRRLAPVDGAE